MSTADAAAPEERARSRRHGSRTRIETLDVVQHEKTLRRPAPDRHRRLVQRIPFDCPKLVRHSPLRLALARVSVNPEPGLENPTAFHCILLYLSNSLKRREPRTDGRGTRVGVHVPASVSVVPPEAWGGIIERTGTE